MIYARQSLARQPRLRPAGPRQGQVGSPRREHSAWAAADLACHKPPWQRPLSWWWSQHSAPRWTHFVPPLPCLSSRFFLTVPCPEHASSIQPAQRCDLACSCLSSLPRGERWEQRGQCDAQVGEVRRPTASACCLGSHEKIEAAAAIMCYPCQTLSSKERWGKLAR